MDFIPAAVVASIIAGGFGILIHFLNMASERRRHINNMAVQLAIEEIRRKHSTEIMLAENDLQRRGQPWQIKYPMIEESVLRMLQFTEGLARFQRKSWFERILDLIRGDCACHKQTEESANPDVP